MFIPVLLLLFTIQFSITVYGNHHKRHLLHQPFFPIEALPPSQAPSYSPEPQPQPQQPKLPFSSSSSTPPERPFFPTYPSPLPPPSPTSLSSFPANISSLLLPPHTSPPHRHVLAIAVSVSVLSALIVVASAALFLYHRRQRNFHTDDDDDDDDKASRSDSLCLYPPNTVTSDGPPKLRGTPTTSTEFLYLGTLVSSRGVEKENVANSSNDRTGLKIGVSSSPYQKLDSPELRPLPPLPKHNVKQSYRNFEGGSDGDEEGDEFFSPRESSESPDRNGSSSIRAFESIGVDNFGSRSFNSRTTSYPCSKSPSPTTSVSNAYSPPLNLSPKSFMSKPTNSVMNFRGPFRPSPTPILPSPTLSTSSSLTERGSGNVQNSPSRNSGASGQRIKSPATNESNFKRFVPLKLPPPPPPPPPKRFWEIPGTQSTDPEGPMFLSKPSKPSGFLQSSLQQTENNETKSIKNDETPKPKLKPLHWDKVKASSDRAMVWDQIKSSSFQLNEEMIETLFTVNGSNLTPKYNCSRQVLPCFNQENRVLDPKKSQNIAILLRALNVTIDEVCEALVEGNCDSLGTELLESLLKMAPTKEEERKLKEFKDESPFKLGPAEKFLKAVVDIPFAFKRVDALLYVANFDSEVEYLRRSFHTLEEACEELKNSRMFLKLLEAVLKTGNRMNVGTNRGDAHAFKLDTLLKLVDVKGTDGKTTLLHFVVQEIIRDEGFRRSGSNHNETTKKSEYSSFQDDIEHRKLGLQVVSRLSGELSNVKKAAAMDSDVLSKEVAKLAEGIAKITEVVKLNEEIALKDSCRKFSESMKEFLKEAGEEIVRLQAQEKSAFSLVKEITEYFHGNSAKEEAHRFRIFMVVRDFFSILDQVCKEVGKANERSMVGSTRQFPLRSTNPMLPPVFPGLNVEQHYGWSDEETSSSSKS